MTADLDDIDNEIAGHKRDLKGAPNSSIHYSQAAGMQTVAAFLSRISGACRDRAKAIEVSGKDAVERAKAGLATAANAHSKHLTSTVALLTHQIEFVSSLIVQLDEKKQKFQELGMHTELRGLPEERRRLTVKLAEVGQRLDAMEAGSGAGTPSDDFRVTPLLWDSSRWRIRPKPRFRLPSSR